MSIGQKRGKLRPSPEMGNIRNHAFGMPGTNQETVRNLAKTAESILAGNIQIPNARRSLLSSRQAKVRAKATTNTDEKRKN